MLITNKEIKKLQLLWENRFGEKISKGQAYEQGAKLIRLVELIYKPITKDEYRKLQKRRQETNDLKTN